MSMPTRIACTPRGRARRSAATRTRRRARARARAARRGGRAPRGSPRPSLPGSRGRSGRRLRRQASFSDGVGGGDDGCAAGHRLGDRHPEALEPRRVDDRGGASVEGRKLIVGHTTEPDDAGPVELGLLAPARAADDGQLELGVGEERERLDQRAEILARLERRDREQVRALAPRRGPVGVVLGRRSRGARRRSARAGSRASPRCRRP